MSRFFDPARLPPRDRYGFTAHPDLELFATNGVPDDAALSKAGFSLTFVLLESDAPELLDAYHGGDNAALARWFPEPPELDGWHLVGVYDTENDPVAVFVRRLS